MYLNGLLYMLLIKFTTGHSSSVYSFLISLLLNYRIVLEYISIIKLMNSIELVINILNVL